jgi:hypothetical protein
MFFDSDSDQHKFRFVINIFLNKTNYFEDVKDQWIIFVVSIRQCLIESL